MFFDFGRVWSVFLTGIVLTFGKTANSKLKGRERATTFYFTGEIIIYFYINGKRPGGEVSEKGIKV